MTKPSSFAVRSLCCVANDKGGVAKSLLAALLFEHLNTVSPEPWTLVEVEQKPSYTQRLYAWPSQAKVVTHALIENDVGSGQPRPSLSPLDELWKLLPAEADLAAPCRIVADFGASAFQSFLLWGIQHRGLEPFIDQGFQMVFVIPVLGSEIESQRFFNHYAPSLLKLGNVVLVRNLIQGDDFSLLNAELVAQVPSMRMLFRGKPLTAEMIQGERRLTYRQLEALPTASRRARLDAKDCAADFEREIGVVTKLFAQ